MAAIESPCTTLCKRVNSNFRSIFNRFGDITGFVHPESFLPRNLSAGYCHFGWLVG